MPLTTTQALFAPSASSLTQRPTPTSLDMRSDAEPQRTADDRSQLSTSSSPGNQPAQSPFGSADGHAGASPISRVFGFNSPMGESGHNAQTSPSISASRQAVHGSGPPSPALRGVDFKARDVSGTSYFPPPRGYTLEQLEEHHDEETLEQANTNVEDKGTQCDKCDCASPTRDPRVVVVDVSPLQAPVDKAGHRFLPVPTDFVCALKQLKRAGHPVHVITTLPSEQKWEVTHWLGKAGLTVGTSQIDGVAAVWHVPAGCGKSKAGVVQAVNAAFVIAPAPCGVEFAQLASISSVECCIVVRADNAVASPTSPVSAVAQSKVVSASGWQDVSRCLDAHIK